MSLQRLRFALDSVRSMADLGLDLENDALRGLVEVLDDVYEDLRVEYSGGQVAVVLPKIGGAA